MALAKVVGQARAIAALRAALRSGSVHHGYLFTGPEGVGKELTAIGLAQALLCLDQPREGCGVCNTCQRIERRIHPDVTWVMPDEERIARGLAARSDFTNAPSRDIRVEQVRQLQERLSLRPLEGSSKVAVLVSAEQLNPQAQNALLKTLEEPPSQTHLVLVTSMPDVLLPTIRSRCSHVQFGPLPRAFVADQVKAKRKVDATTAELVAAMSSGSLARALSLDVDGLARRAELIQRFEQLSPDDARPALRFAEDFATSRDHAEDALTILSWWLRDLEALKIGATDSIANRDLEPLLVERAPRYDDAAIHRCRELIAEAQEALIGNAAPRLQLERVLLGRFSPGAVP